jgi:hypothetical protein
MSQENVEVVREHIEAFRQGDPPGALSYLDPHVVLDRSRVRGPDFGVAYGHEAVNQTMRHYMGGSDGGSRNWQEAEKYCTDLGLRVPSVSEAVALAKKYDVPGVASGNSFWTDAYYPTTFEGVSTVGSVIVSEDGFRLAQKDDGSRFGTVWVTDPSA